MKRYKILAYLEGTSPETEAIESINGEWVKWEDAQSLSFSNNKNWAISNECDPIGDIGADYPCKLLIKYMKEGKLRLASPINCTDCEFRESCTHILRNAIRKTKDILKPNPRCFFVFKGTFCGYIGDEDWCDGTLKRCKELGNEKHWPIPPKKRGE